MQKSFESSPRLIVIGSNHNNLAYYGGSSDMINFWLIYPITTIFHAGRYYNIDWESYRVTWYWNYSGEHVQGSNYQQNSLNLNYYWVCLS